MSESGPDQVSRTTHEVEAEEAGAEHLADRAPTAEEEEAAERNRLDPEVAHSFVDMSDKGVNVKGEGQIA